MFVYSLVSTYYVIDDKYQDIARNDVDYIMETFPIFKRKDEGQCGVYCTKRVMLEIDDTMRRAIVTGESYRTVLDLPPADPYVAHPDRDRPV